MLRRASLALLLLSVAATGRASTRAFAETYETRTGTQGDAQIESWIDDNDAFGIWNVWRFWWGFTASITDSVEVSAYLLGAQQSAGQFAAGAAAPSPDASSGLQLEMVYLMSRWRLLGDGAKGFSLAGQLELCLPALGSSADQQEFPLLAHASVLGERVIASYDLPHFLFSANLLADEAVVYGVTGIPSALKWSAGAAWAPFGSGPRGPAFTAGVEAFGDVAPSVFGYHGAFAVQWPGGFPVAVGPALSVASGRFWATASWGYAPSGAAVVSFDPTSHAYQLLGWSAAEGVGRLIVALEL